MPPMVTCRLVVPRLAATSQPAPTSPMTTLTMKTCLAQASMAPSTVMSLVSSSSSSSTASTPMAHADTHCGGVAVRSILCIHHCSSAGIASQGWVWCQQQCHAFRKATRHHSGAPGKLEASRELHSWHRARRYVCAHITRHSIADIPPIIALPDSFVERVMHERSHTPVRVPSFRGASRPVSAPAGSFSTGHGLQDHSTEAGDISADTSYSSADSLDTSTRLQLVSHLLATSTSNAPSRNASRPPSRGVGPGSAPFSSRLGSKVSPIARPHTTSGVRSGSGNLWNPTAGIAMLSSQPQTQTQGQQAAPLRRPSTGQRVRTVPHSQHGVRLTTEQVTEAMRPRSAAAASRRTPSQRAAPPTHHRRKSSPAPGAADNQQQQQQRQRRRPSTRVSRSRPATTGGIGRVKKGRGRIFARATAPFRSRVPQGYAAWEHVVPGVTSNPTFKNVPLAALCETDSDSFSDGDSQGDGRLDSPPNQRAGLQHALTGAVASASPRARGRRRRRSPKRGASPDTGGGRESRSASPDKTPRSGRSSSPRRRRVPKLSEYEALLETAMQANRLEAAHNSMWSPRYDATLSLYMASCRRCDSPFVACRVGVQQLKGRPACAHHTQRRASLLVSTLAPRHDITYLSHLGHTHGILTRVQPRAPRWCD